MRNSANDNICVSVSSDITNWDSEIFVSNCSFVNCTADNGGAVYCGGGLIRDSFFNGNFAVNESNIFNTGEMVLENNVFDVIGGNSSNPGNLSPTSFLGLQTLVNGAEEGGVIELSGNHVNGSGTEINIDKSLTINGNGTTLDAKELSLVFHITADNVVLSNINFVNCYSGLGAGGGAIYWKGTNGRLVNCTFINCKSITACGGAVYLNGSYASVEDCSFVNCSAINTYQNLYYYALGVSSYGGAIFLSSYAENCSVKNCNFINSTVRASAYSEDIRGVSSDTSSYGHGGAVYWAGDNGCLMDCSFENSFADADSISGHSTLHSYSTAHSYGGAVFWSGNEGSISNCSFENSNAEASAVAGYGSNSFGSSTYSHGGALYLTGSSNHVSDCRFVNCSVDAKSGCVNIVEGGVSWDVNLSSPVYSINSSGGAICFDEDCNGNVVGCSFIDCSSNGDYNHVVVNAKSIVDCIFNPIDNSTLDVGGENTTDTNITDVTGDNTTNTTGNATNGNAADTNTTDATGNDTSNTTKPTPEMVVPPLDKPSSDGSVIISLPGDATGKVTLTINGKDYDYDIENGIVNVIIPNLRDGNYPYTITYSGDSKYSSLTNNCSLKVNNTSVNPVENQTNSTVNPDNKTETTENNTSQENMPVIDNSKIVASNVNVVYSAGSYYTITVYGTDGKPANTVVKITGKISKTLTATNGIAKFKIDQVPGTYKITITALGKSVSKTITVKHLVSLKTVKVKKSAKKLVLQATLGKINGKYLKNKKITFKFNGKKFTAKTNKRGVAKVTIKSKVFKKLKVGKKVTYQATYLKDTVKKIVKIKK